VPHTTAYDLADVCTDGSAQRRSIGCTHRFAHCASFCIADRIAFSVAHASPHICTHSCTHLGTYRISYSRANGWSNGSSYCATNACAFGRTECDANCGAERSSHCST